MTPSFWTSRMLLTFLVATLPLSLAVEEGVERHHHDHHFDLLILTQHWPYTTCLEWEDREGSCRKIEQARWTVHGLWPTQLGKIAPNFCNNSWHFDPAVLTPIRGNLTVFWPDVEVRKTPNSLWDHEWTKHGTCAAQLQEMDSEVKYFAKGCELAEANPVTDWLVTAGVMPNKKGTQYNMKAVWDAVMAGTGGKRPHIDCDEVEGEAYISEIKVCYDKSFNRVDCDGIKSQGMNSTASESMMGKCLRYSSFLYPSTTVLPHKLRGVAEGSGSGTPTTTTTTHSPTTTTTSSSPPVSNSGLVAGVVCTILALVAVGLAVGYIVYRRGRRSNRGYESL